MAKLSAQFETGDPQFLTTRTERVGAKQQAIKSEQQFQKEKAEFEDLQSQAKNIQETKFVDRVDIVDEQYNTYRPANITARSWNRLSARSKASHLRQFYRGRGINYYHSKGYVVVHSTPTRKVEKIVPFTIEDVEGTADNSYKDVYDTLSPDLKKFFSTPAQAIKQKAETIAGTKTQVTARYSYRDQELQQAKDRLTREIAKYQKRRDELKDKHKAGRLSDEKYRERRDDLNKDLQEEEDRLEETTKYWQGYTKGIGQGIAELDAGKNLTYASIKNYADDLGDYEEAKKRARNQNYAFEKAQNLEIKYLKEAGYTPYEVKSFKGNQPSTVDFGFYNAKLGDYKTLATYNIDAPVNVKGLKSLGFSAPQDQTISYAGKDYTFKSSVQIFKDTKGQVVTPYKQTGFTEQQLIKQSQDLAYADFQKTQTKNIPFKVLTGTDLPLGYGGQQTISDQPTSVLIPQATYDLQQKKNVFKDVGGFASNVWSKIPQGKFYYNPPSFRDLSGGISIFKKSDKSIDLTSASQQADTELYQKNIDLLVSKALGNKQGDLDKLEDDLSFKFQGEYQKEFEKEYGKNLIYDEITFGKAQEDFEKSDQAKLLQVEFQEEYQEGYKKISSDVSKGRALKYGVPIIPLKVLQLVNKAVSTPKNLATAGVLTYGGVKAFKGIAKLPSSVHKLINLGFTGYGTVKFLSPTSTFEERAGGFVMAGIGAGSLGYGGYRYLRSQKVIRVPHLSPKATLKASETLGLDLKKNVLFGKAIGGATGGISKAQQLAQAGTGGSRAISISQGRLLSNKFWRQLGVPKHNLYKGAYRGIPTRQLGQTYKLSSFRGSYNYKTQSAYQKAYKSLVKYNKLSPWKAKQTLRLDAGHVDIDLLDRGILAIQGNKAVGEFYHLRKRPIIDIDKSIGLKTRGGRTIATTYDVRRIIVKNKFVLEQNIKTSFALKRGASKLAFKDSTLNLKKIFAKSKDFKIGIYKGKDIGSLSLGRNVMPRSNVFELEGSRTKLIQGIIDKSRASALQSPASIRKTPFTITFKDINVKNLVKQLSNKQGTAWKDIVKMDQQFGTSSSQTKTAIDSAYGTGQYERTIGGMDLQQGLRSAVIPDPFKSAQLKDLINIKGLDTLTGVKVGTLTGVKLNTLFGVGSLTKTKTDLQLKSLLETGLKTNVLTKTDMLTKTALKSSIALKTATALKTSQLLRSAPATRTTLLPPTTAPIIPRTPPFKPTGIVLPFPALKRAIQKRRKKKGSVWDRAYLPDFTAKALGLKAETVTMKQAQKKLKKLLTGLEVRRGVIIK